MNKSPMQNSVQKPIMYMCDGGYCKAPAGVINGNIRMEKEKIHSLYFYIEYKGKKILYDTGYDNKFLENPDSYTKMFHTLIEVPHDQKFIGTQDLFNDDEIDLVIISHYHPDHIAGLHRFTNAKFLAWGLPKTGLSSGFVPTLLPNDFHERLTIVPDSEKTTALDLPAYKVLGCDMLVSILLKGHSSVHSGLLIGKKVFLVGDAVWTRQTFREFAYPSFITKFVQENIKEHTETIKFLNRCCREEGLDIIPSHCPEISKLLNGNPYMKIDYDNVKRPVVKILVTGSSGFLGQNIIKMLSNPTQQEKFSIVACGRKDMTFSNKDVVYEQFDITDHHMVDVILGQHKPDLVIHCAALCKPWGKWNDFYKGNVEGTQNMLNASLKNNVERFIHISSPSVYFNNYFEREPGVSEGSFDPYPMWMKSYYTQSKLLAEYKVMEILPNSQMETIILRPRGIYGAGDTTLLPRLMEKINSIPFLGTNDVDLTHVQNVAHSAYCAMYNGVPGCAYNITDDRPYNINTLLNDIACKTDTNRKLNNEKFYWINFAIVWVLSFTCECIFGILLWLGIDIEPPLSMYGCSLLTQNCTIGKSNAKIDLKYGPVIQNGIYLTLSNMHLISQSKKVQNKAPNKLSRRNSC